MIFIREEYTMCVSLYSHLHSQEEHSYLHSQGKNNDATLSTKLFDERLQATQIQILNSSLAFTEHSMLNCVHSIQVTKKVN